MADIPLDPRLQAQLLDLYRMSGDRIASTQPVHDAAMAMATRLAPGYARQAMRPAPTPSAPLSTGNLGQTGGMSPAAKAALAALASAASNGASGNVGALVKKLLDWFHRNDPNNWPMSPGDGFGGDHTSTFGGRDPFGNNLQGYDPGWFNDPSIFGGLPDDPSGGTNVGPGMQDYYNTPDYSSYEPGGENFSGPIDNTGGSFPDNTIWGY